MKKLHKVLTIFIITLLLVGALTPMILPIEKNTTHAHPLLLQMAVETPEQDVAIIVQKADDTHQAEELAVRLGGAITKDLDIINAFAAEIKVTGAVKLAQSSYVRWVSLDTPVERSAKPPAEPLPLPPITTNTYLQTLNVESVWNQGLTGSGIGVAVIDSGMSNISDLAFGFRSSFSTSPTVNDNYGHGTHVGGIIAGNGSLSGGVFKGVAPGVNLLSLKVADDAGMAYESDVVEALQWVLNNKVAYNIRVVNISLNSTVEQTYFTSPLDAAVEILWFNGVVVVVSSGNSTDGINYANMPPANDPFVITVGAADEKATASWTDDAIATYTSWTVTANLHLKPDIFAPGSNIISTLSPHSTWDDLAPERVVQTNYFRLSGTSMAAPMVTGAVALLLQDEPNLTPDQVKYRLLNASGRTLSYYYKPTRTTFTFPYLDIAAVVNGATTASSNTGFPASQLLWTGTDPITWNSVSWNSVSWNSVSWNSVSWNSVSWNSVSWNSAFWGE